ncbi:hypothetical protein SAMN04488558_11325 [Ignavigranum ruoffiae]|uniref:Uncharacterized protein n=1 Tax=Ignavigranum ruoffiae TaxID=89093 RepID=A0A1H9GF26_9LACT|nr:hypothetical protein [Ignavigranum ruoffiae]SEQ48725.1 hypothetical protein SAMN04488558_11325 [Ignavigranum ruoffiae]
MKNLLYLILAAVLVYVIYNLWQVDTPESFALNGGILAICVIVYYLLSRRQEASR